MKKQSKGVTKKTIFLLGVIAYFGFQVSCVLQKKKPEILLHDANHICWEENSEITCFDKFSGKVVKVIDKKDITVVDYK